MGYSTGLLVKMGQFRTLAKSREIHPNNRASTYKSICEHVRGVSEKFGAISDTYQNRPCSKAWAIAQAFWSKWANFGPLQNHGKSTQTIAQALRNLFASM